MPPLSSSVALAPHTTFKVGGTAAQFAPATTPTELAALVQHAQAHELPVRFLGSGSNVIAPDGELWALVIHNQLMGWEVVTGADNVLLTVGAGMVLDEVVARTVAQGWWGLENLSHIPGTVGATPIQNVGAYGTEVADVIESVTVYDMATNTSHVLRAADCQFAYRHSLFKTANGQRYLITAVTFRLSRQPQPLLTYPDLQGRFADRTPTQSEIREAVIDIRQHKFPDWRTVGTAGSFFKNPIVQPETATALLAQYPGLPHYPATDGQVKLSLGWILDKVCNVRGYCAGPLCLSPAQALVMINHGGATAHDVTAFADVISQRVREKTQLTITPEVTFW
jgi:UDP-N-acetylmuramate dehydrogenase